MAGFAEIFRPNQSCGMANFRKFPVISLINRELRQSMVSPTLDPQPAFPVLPVRTEFPATEHNGFKGDFGRKGSPHLDHAIHWLEQIAATRPRGENWSTLRRTKIAISRSR
jgi:hypothetical protein